MKKILNENLFHQISKDMLKNKHVFGSVLCMENQDESISYIKSEGNMKEDDTYFIASVTKLYITAIMMMLKNQKKLDFDDKITQYFDYDFISGIHMLKGVDYTNSITIRHLLSNTSGLPDYFYYDKKSGEAANDIISGRDEAWPLSRAIQSVRNKEAKFKPGQKKKVFYSDTNYQLLGGIIERVTHYSIKEAFKVFIFDPLKLKNTYAYANLKDQNPVLMYFNKEKVIAPNYMASVTAEGGIVSSAKEVMIFLKAFFNGFFFPVDQLESLKTDWRLILFPGQFYFGLGLEKLWIPRIYSSFKKIDHLYGFWGQSGAFAFYHEDTKTYYTGTINQASGFGHGSALFAIIKIIKTLKYKI
jgi:D-alanyl-D-alanine carboxypeptidase